ncbi:hypothetical protein TWF506_004002 [Arthrobotrys conoides]|uniref:Uncharacterized protein n=1 Tax=Arthrobotrys conoides TaxID=74498 RepID=A0AAN8RTQ9_9PEZI
MKLYQFLTETKAPPLITYFYTKKTQKTDPLNPRNPQIDLEEWHDIKSSISALLGPYLDKDYPRLLSIQLGSETVHSKEDIMICAEDSFEATAQWVLKEVFDISGKFSSSKPFFNFGNTDKVFHLSEESTSTPNNPTQPKARFAIEYKTSWELPLPANLRNIYNENKSDPNNKYTKAIQQLYGRLCFNNLEFGVLSNYNSTFIFRRLPNQRLQVSPAFWYSDTFLENPVAALTYVCHYTATKQWRRCSPLAGGAISPSMEEHLLDFDPNMEFLNNELPILDWRNILLRLETKTCDQPIACLMTGSMMEKSSGTLLLKNVRFKIYDLTNPEADRRSRVELEAYKQCRTLQGAYIPRLYAVGTVWGLLRVFITENFGTPLEGETFFSDEQEQMSVILRKIHDCGMMSRVQPEYFAVSRQGQFQMRLIELGFVVKSPRTSSAIEMDDPARLRSMLSSRMSRQGW